MIGIDPVLIIIYCSIFLFVIFWIKKKEKSQKKNPEKKTKTKPIQDCINWAEIHPSNQYWYSLRTTLDIS